MPRISEFLEVVYVCGTEETFSFGVSLGVDDSGLVPTAEGFDGDT